MDEKRLKQLREETLKFRGALAHLKTTTGRRRYENCSSYIISVVEDPFVADELALLRSTALRRLEAKTQVAVIPLNNYMRTRGSHTQEVKAESVEMAHLLGLNESLVRAISLGHDVGHVPFGHPGEHFLSRELGKDFTHEVMGVVVAQHIERHGYGLNLTFEVLDGMMRHSGKNVTDAMTQEAWVVRFADKIAYLFADYNDLLRMRYKFIPSELTSLMNDFGSTQRERTAIVTYEICKESAEAGKVVFEKSEFAEKFNRIRTLMYDIYPRVTQQSPEYIIEPIMNFLRNLPDIDPFLVFALMTDKDVWYLSQQFMVNNSHLEQTSVYELIEDIQKFTNQKLDYTNPDLEWGYAK